MHKIYLLLLSSYLALISPKISICPYCIFKYMFTYNGLNK
ncbi:hypothetical protein GY50_1141 [Dehalococcoides mccartyi GY50]|nr:hypothetical protein GY50_1141 [Dehalococcoides mccartyi GY50]